MSEIYVTSDTHYFHKNIIDHCNRPFKTTEEMNEVMIERHNSRVSSGDIILHLGDFGLTRTSEWKSIMDRLNGYKILVLGNHDKSATKMKDLWFDIVCEEYYFSHRELTFWAAHIPVQDEPDHRGYTRPLLQGPYDIALCGHVHDKWKYNKRGCINVGVDMNNFYPYHIDEIIEYYQTAVSG